MSFIGALKTRKTENSKISTTHSTNLAMRAESVKTSSLATPL